MAIGISTASYYPLETEEALIEVGKAGAKVSEIFFNTSSELKSHFLDMLNDIKDSYGIRIPSVHTYTATADGYMFFSNYPRRLFDSLREFDRFYEAASALGAEYVIFHGDKQVGKLPDEVVAERYMMLEERAKSYGVHLLQENVNKFRSSDPEFISALRENTNDQALFCFDVKQAVRSGHTPDEIIEAMGSKIRHVHISDHSPASDCLLPFKGKYNFEELFRKMQNLGYNGDYMIEVYSNAYKDYSELAETLKKLTSIGCIAP